ncbi:sulfur oxidation c-type cytochrome SoxX [Roseovarius autotrophicus]|uniref:sulfur oxidation c-type cytochrome SoxX n=1 Tax=Roseovarius autotrophicus TaxID=2824121 RepID=UPI0019F5CFFD|nr:sulfur oxidation c-type cytochrome SoxX [Roseovarius autotrophicus]MBE0453114.1 sulfur oxidation c-type cytochrome SoxX [Roseovarius sp.]
MKRTIIALSLAGMATSVTAAEIAPGDVAFEDGAITVSLTGQPGDPARGREVLGSRSLGNCVACHANSEMADIPFHGEIGPMLDGTGDRWTEAELRGIVANAKEMFPGSMMPSFYRVDGYTRPGNAFTGKAADETFGPLLTAQQIEDVVAYLVTLKD